MKLAGPGHGEDSLRESFASIGLVAEAEFPPLDGRTNSLFRGIISGFHPLMGEECEQVIPIGERAFGSSAHLRVGAASVLEAVAFHSSPHESRGIQELWASDAAFTESMPATKDVPDLLEHICGEHVSIRAAAALLEPFELPDHVGPAKLPDPFLVVAAVGGMIIGGDHPFEDTAQNGPEDFGPPACSYGEINHERRDEDPKVATLPFAFPSGLIDVEVPRLGKAFSGFFHHGLQLGTDPLDAVAHAPQAHG